MQSIHLFLESYQDRKDIKKGQKVNIIKKEHQKQNIKTKGIVKDILTPKQRHTRGIKVRLITGEIGRVSDIL